MNILLLTPPLTQLNTPYPATTVLKGFLQSKKHHVRQADLGIELIHHIYSAEGLQQLGLAEEYIYTVEPVMHFLQGRNPALAHRIANRTLLPEGLRFENDADLEWAFGTSGITDKAKHLATLYVEDIADYIRENISPRFDLIRYAEQIALSAPVFDALHAELQNPVLNIIDQWMLELLEEEIEKSHPQLIGFTIPFPGCFYAALKCGEYIKKHHPHIKIAVGGGYINTELRTITDARLFDYIDYMLLDDGESALLRLAEFLENRCTESGLIRCFYLNKQNRITYSGNDEQNIPFAETGTPDFSDLPLDKYFSMIELTNPMHKLWTDGRWNKMTVAHGCYWAQCAFCDTSLDYICRYDAPPAAVVVDRMEAVIKQTGETGFHFTDEALPPVLLRKIAEEIIRRKLTVSYWGNIRFEKSYTPELCDLLAQSGCIAVSGGLEAASDRLLKLMNKGVSIAQAARSFRNFIESGIMVHAYLMYGFPTETLQETIDSLEVVRQMFDLGLIQSAFWHRYTMTIHSPSGKNPEKFGAEILNLKQHPFANNGVEFSDNQKLNLEAVGEGLHKAVYNYMHGIGLDFPLQEWFTIRIPKTTHKRSLIESYL